MYRSFCLKLFTIVFVLSSSFLAHAQRNIEDAREREEYVVKRLQASRVDALIQFERYNEQFRQKFKDQLDDLRNYDFTENFWLAVQQSGKTEIDFIESNVNLHHLITTGTAYGLTELRFPSKMIGAADVQRNYKTFMAGVNEGLYRNAYVSTSFDKALSQLYVQHIGEVKNNALNEKWNGVRNLYYQSLNWIDPNLTTITNAFLYSSNPQFQIKVEHFLETQFREFASGKLTMGEYIEKIETMRMAIESAMRIQYPRGGTLGNPGYENWPMWEPYEEFMRTEVPKHVKGVMRVNEAMEHMRSVLRKHFNGKALKAQVGNATYRLANIFAPFFMTLQLTYSGVETISLCPSLAKVN